MTFRKYIRALVHDVGALGRQFEVGRVYTFCDITEPDGLPDEMLIWADAEDTGEVRV